MNFQSWNCRPASQSWHFLSSEEVGIPVTRWPVPQSVHSVQEAWLGDDENFPLQPQAKNRNNQTAGTDVTLDFIVDHACDVKSWGTYGNIADGHATSLAGLLCHEDETKQNDHTLRFVVVSAGQVSQETLLLRVLNVSVENSGRRWRALDLGCTTSRRGHLLESFPMLIQTKYRSKNKFSQKKGIGTEQNQL